MPFVDTAELAMIMVEAHVAIHRGLAGLLDTASLAASATALPICRPAGGTT